MKFQDLAIGTRFEFEGETYTKTDTLLATSAAGARRLIRRSANLMPLHPATGNRNVRSESPDTLDRDRTLRAFEVFYRSSLDAGADPAQLETARRRFLDDLA